jgi:hypothetical protein
MVLNNRLRGILGLVIWAFSAPAHGQSVVSSPPASHQAPAVIGASSNQVAGRGPIAAAAVRAVVDSVTLVQSRPNRRSRGSCREKMWLGFGVGAGGGIAYGALAWRGVDEPGKFMAATTGLFGLVGLAVGLKLCD